MHKEDLNICICRQIFFGDQTMRNEVGGTLSTNRGKGVTACNILVEKPERRRPLGKPRYRWEDNMKKGNQEIGWEGVD